MICACSIRRISTSHGGRVFIMMNVLSLISAAADLWMELVVSATPLSPAAVALGTALSYTYKVCRNATLVIYLIFIFVITRTEYRIRSPWVRLLLWLPNAVMLLTLAQNPFTHNVFTVTAEAGYARGPALNILYVLALLYGVAGTAYCIYCKRYLALRKWAGLLSIYVLTFAAVLLQFFRSDLLVEMFCAAIGLLMILLLVLRPEETVDTGVGVQNWEAYQNDLRNVLLSRQKVQLVAVSMTNAQEIAPTWGRRSTTLMCSKWRTSCAGCTAVSAGMPKYILSVPAPSILSWTRRITIWKRWCRFFWLKRGSACAVTPIWACALIRGCA